MFDVTLTKGSNGLGFTVAGGQQTVGLFYVKDVLFDPALGCGEIKRGDRLIAVSCDYDVILLRTLEFVVMLNCFLITGERRRYDEEDTP